MFSFADHATVYTTSPFQRHDPLHSVGTFANAARRRRRVMKRVISSFWRPSSSSSIAPKNVRPTSCFSVFRLESRMSNGMWFRTCSQRRDRQNARLGITGRSSTAFTMGQPRSHQSRRERSFRLDRAVRLDMIAV